MKKIAALFLAAPLIFSLMSCDGKSEEDKKSDELLKRVYQDSGKPTQPIKKSDIMNGR